MTIFATAYDTTVGQGFVTAPIVAALQEAIIRNDFALKNMRLPAVGFTEKPGEYNPSLISNHSAEELALPFYIHPIAVTFPGMKSRENQKFIIGDVRPFLAGSHTTSQNTADLLIKNQTEFSLMKMRTALTAHWMNGGINDIKYLSSNLLSIYCSWISENIAQRFALDRKDQQILAILAGLLYMSLYTEESEFSELQKQKMTALISKATFATSEMVFDVLDQAKKMGNIQDFCDAARVVTENPRLNDLNHGLMVAIISSTWYGTNAKGVAAVAIEHPPTFVSIVYGGLVERTFKNSPLARICERYRGNKGEVEFTRSLKVLLSKLY